MQLTTVATSFIFKLDFANILFIPKAIVLIKNVFLHLSYSIDLLILVLESASLTLQKYW